MKTVTKMANINDTGTVMLDSIYLPTQQTLQSAYDDAYGTFQKEEMKTVTKIANIGDI